MNIRRVRMRMHEDLKPRRLYPNMELPTAIPKCIPISKKVAFCYLLCVMHDPCFVDIKALWSPKKVIYLVTEANFEIRTGDNSKTEQFFASMMLFRSMNMRQQGADPPPPKKTPKQTKQNTIELILVEGQEDAPCSASNYK